MKTSCFLFILCLVFFGVTSRLMAEPVNFMIGDLTFVRPTAWAWVTPEKSKLGLSPAFVVLRVFSDGKQSAFAAFYQEKTDDNAVTNKWTAYFDAASGQTTTLIEKKKIEKYKLTFVSIEGNLKNRGKKPESDFALIGGIIEGGNKTIYIRILAPKALVKDATDELSLLRIDGQRIGRIIQ